MTYFLCIATPHPVSDWSKYFATPFHWRDASQFSLGRATLGRWRGAAVLINIGDSATDVLDKGYWRDKASKQFVTALRALCQDSTLVALVIHWFHGSLLTENVKCVRDEEIGVQALAERFPEIDADVRYVVTLGARASEPVFPKGGRVHQRSDLSKEAQRHGNSVSEYQGLSVFSVDLTILPNVHHTTSCGSLLRMGRSRQDASSCEWMLG